MDREALLRLLVGFSQGGLMGGALPSLLRGLTDSSAKTKTGADGQDFLRQLEERQKSETPELASLAASGTTLPSTPSTLSRRMPLPRLNTRTAPSSQRLSPLLRAFERGGRYV